MAPEDSNHVGLKLAVVVVVRNLNFTNFKEKVFSPKCRIS